MKKKFKNFFFIKDFLDFFSLLKFKRSSSFFLNLRFIISDDTVDITTSVLKKLLKKLNFDKIYNKFLKGFFFIHFSKIVTDVKYKRIFVLYKKLKKFLYFY